MAEGLAFLVKNFSTTFKKPTFCEKSLFFGHFNCFLNKNKFWHYLSFQKDLSKNKDFKT